MGAHSFGVRPGTNSSLAWPAAAFESLTIRERDVLTCITKGVSYKETAQCLFVSENTIKFHLKNIYSKLGASNRLQAANTARSLRLID